MFIGKSNSIHHPRGCLLVEDKGRKISALFVSHQEKEYRLAFLDLLREVGYGPINLYPSSIQCLSLVDAFPDRKDFSVLLEQFAHFPENGRSLCTGCFAP